MRLGRFYSLCDEEHRRRSRRKRAWKGRKRRRWFVDKGEKRSVCQKGPRFFIFESSENLRVDEMGSREDIELKSDLLLLFFLDRKTS